MSTLKRLSGQDVSPDHKELDTGTLRAIVRQASAYIDLETLKNHFYSK